jgi:hypothetical protein
VVGVPPRDNAESKRRVRVPEGHEPHARSGVSLCDGFWQQRHPRARGDRKEYLLEVVMGQLFERRGHSGLTAGGDDAVVKGAVGLARKHDESFRGDAVEPDGGLCRMWMLIGSAATARWSSVATHAVR